MRFLVLLFIFFLTSCQDTKTSIKTTDAQTQKINSTHKKEQSIKKEDAKKIVKNTKITNKNAIDFLLKYGQENPEKKVRIETKFGNIEMELYDDTPLHRANFIHIVKRKFLDETCFYRVAKGFVIQGGNSDKLSMAKIKNSIGSFTIPGEFRNNLKHNYGAVAMARLWKGNPHKRSSPFEFYIVVDPKGAHHLNKEHTVIGRVTKGMDVAQKISKIKTDQSEWPIQDIYMKAKIME